MPRFLKRRRASTRAGVQHGHLVSLLPVRPAEVTGQVREIEAQLAQGPEDHTGAGRHKVGAAYAVALRVGPVPLARPEYFLEQGASVEPGDAGCRVGADQAPARVDAGAVVDDGIVEVDEHRAGRDHGAILWGHRVLATNRADRSGEVAGQLPHYKSTTKRSRRLDSDLTKDAHNDNVVCMIPELNSEGLLPPGVHWASWDELMVRFGNSSWRQDLMDGLRAALENLKRAGCRTVYVNGSFVTNKYVPNDYDACWEEAGVEPEVLDPVLLTFDPGRVTQKAKYLGELFPASIIADSDGLSFLDFFQTDKDTGTPKGIVAIDLGGLT